MNPQQQGQDVYDVSGKGTFATNGVTPSFAKPIATPQTAAANMATLRPAGASQENPTQEQEELEDDYLESLFDGENLSEHFKFKAKTIFEAAVNERVSILEAHIVQAAKELIEEQSQAAKEVVLESTQQSQEELIEHIDGYLGYVISEWMEQNKVAVERGLRTEIAENFIHGLKDLFEASFIDVPQEKYDVLDDIFGANEELQENVNNLIKENISLKNEINAHLCAEAFMQQTSGLTDTQVEKLAKLAEGIEFENVDQYAQKVALLKESYFTKGESNIQRIPAMLVEDTGSFVSDGTSSDPLMESVMNTISKIQRNQPKVEKLHQDPASARLASILNTNKVQDKFI